MNRTPVILLAAAIVVAAAAGAWVSRATLERSTPVQLQHGTLLEPRAPLPDLSLVSDEGKTVSIGQFRGQWSFVFFGFTHCPDVCPTTLAKLAEVRRRLSDLPPGDQPRVQLVTVDPERDTPEVMAEYLEGFDPAFSGLTGTRENVDAFAAALGVAHRRIPMGGEQYMVDHTSVVMLIDPHGRRAAVFSSPFEVNAIESDYRRLVTGTRG